ncbi:MAG: TIGR00282 family metallophosphoesterase [Verrucomicrobiota bacterium]
MRLVFLGDVVGEPGREAIKQAVPKFIDKWGPDFIVVNGENAAGGKGITPKLAYELLRAKIDVITLGDHCWDQREIQGFFEEEPRLIRPFNFPDNSPGKGWVRVHGNGKKLAVINALGRTFMPFPVDNPFSGIDELLLEVKKETPCVLVDFHAETTSEKIAFGHHCDGKVSAVLGTHTHVQTADEKVLEKGTAYITDVGFCGPHDSVIGRDKKVIVDRFLTLMHSRMPVATSGNQADGVMLEIDDDTGKAISIQRIQESVEDGL